LAKYFSYQLTYQQEQKKFPTVEIERGKERKKERKKERNKERKKERTSTP
jgi:hypothetical protein